MSASACSNSAAATTQRTSPLLTALITKQDTLPLTADLTGDGKADIVGFGEAGVWVSLNNGHGTFAQPAMAVANFGYSAGVWRAERHPRFVAGVGAIGASAGTVD